MLLGGSALPLGIASEASAKGMVVHAGYGMSETCPLLCLTYLRDEDLALSVRGATADRASRPARRCRWST